ncbi:MAG: hypothetical protein LBT36_05740 [Oscillospiraceae bacterium]|jgi:hypothetical protein|nr:hypothetical protein [Oscillospiraceae bacterium]
MLQNKDSFVNLLDAPYSRRGSFLCFANDNQGEDLYGKCNLWLCSSRIKLGENFNFNVNNNFRVVKLQLIHDGHPVPYVIDTTPCEVAIRSRYGAVRFVFAETKLIAAAADAPGISLRLTVQKPMAPMWFQDPEPVAPPTKTDSAVLDFPVGKVLVYSDNLWQNSDYVEVRPSLNPGNNGKLVVWFEDFFKAEPKIRDTYPSYDEGLASVKADFDGYAARICPKLPAEFEPGRLKALWQTWQMTVVPDGESAYKRTMVKMVHSIFEGAFVWQQPLQAIVHSRDLPLAWDIYCSGFEHMGEDGKLTDSLTYEEVPSFGLKPPVHGAALLWLMDNTDFASIPKDSKAWVYDGLVKWTEFWTKNRDTDGDGVVEFSGLLETGWEDAPYFNVGFPCACPDLNALVALQMDALARLGRDIGKPESECAKWADASKTLAGKLVEKFWNGEEWFAFNAKTGEKSATHTVSLYFALLLGDRLPKDVIDKSIAYMFADNHFDTKYGLATETLDSDYFFHGFTQGSVIAPSSFWLALALEGCGRSDLAKKVSRAYCAMLRDTGYFHIHNALTGREDRSLTAFGEKGLFWSAWASSSFLYLAEKYGD